MMKLFFNNLVLILTMMMLCFSVAEQADAQAIVKSRIVSLAPMITKTLFLLDTQDKLIANTTYCNTPEGAVHKPKIGSLIHINVEKIISMHPDLIIASPLSKEKELLFLEKNGISVMKLKNPKNFDEMCEMTESIGKVVGKVETAKKIVSQARSEVEQIIAWTHDLPRPRVFIQIDAKPLYSVNKDIFIHEYIRLGGGINIVENESSGIYSREKVLAENPDIILIAAMGKFKNAGRIEKEEWKKFSFLKASATDNIHVLDADIICSPTLVSFVKGLNIIARLLHPDMVNVQ